MDPLIHPAHHAAAVTPHDSNDILKTRGLYAGAAGDVKVIIGGETVTFVDLAAGIIHPLQVTRVFSTGTTATDIVAIY